MKIKNTLLKCLAVISNGVFVSTLSVFILQFIFFQYDFEKTIWFFDYNTRLSLLQIMVVVVIFMWLYFLTTSLQITSLFLIFIAIALGIATEQKLLYRSEPVYPSDIYFLKDFDFLFEMVDTSIVVIFFTLIIVLFLGIYFYYKNRKRKTLNKFHYLARFVGLSLSTLGILYINQFNQPDNKIKSMFNEYTEWISYSQNNNYRENGVVSGFLYNLKSPAVDKPENYSEKIISELYDKYSQKAEIINTDRKGNLADYNLIFIMSETFSDPMRIEGVTISEDPIPLFRQLSQNNLTGMSLSQGYGGGTANIEFEALTGVSLEPLSSTITTPFIQMSNQMAELPSIAEWMKESGHALTTVHPYNSSMYKRLDNYVALGFDQSLFEEDFSQTERIDSNNFISDKSAYLEVLNAMSESKEKDFVHLVTMNNHKPHVNKYENVEFTVTGAPYNLEVAHYAKGIQYSDKELADFIDQINKIEEKTIVVFWGDHLPAFYGEDLFKMNGHLKMHETPLLFYTNFSEDSRDIGTISPMFFINHILEIAEEPITPFVALLESLEEVLPAFEKGIYLERETSEKRTREELKPSTQLLLKDYDTILYDITTGKNYSKKMGFY